MCECKCYDKLAPLKSRFPVGTEVRVMSSDLDEYVGQVGVVADYDPGMEYDAPLVGVVFNTPVKHGLGEVTRDGFYDDELMVAADYPLYLQGKRVTNYEEDKVSVLCQVRLIEKAMDEIVRLAQKNPDIDHLITKAYPFARSLDEESCQVNVWREAMQEAKLDD